MVLKLLLIVVLVVLVAAMLGKGWRNAKSSLRSQGRRKPAGEPPSPVPMLACARCGVHLPQAEALIGNEGRGYCCEAHRAAGPD